MNMKVDNISIKDLKPYTKNTKKHDKKQIDNVAESIRQYGFVQPIVIDSNNIIVIGHCRYEAAKKLKMQTVPCVRVDDLTEEQVKALRIVDNKSNESPWDMDLLPDELADIDLSGFDFDFDLQDDEEDDDFEERERIFQERMANGEISEEDEEYQEFLRKFELKKTTDDCYTPQIVFEAVADYVADKYNLDKKNFVRPFYPGGDYKKEKYKPNDVVVDNPPFSIMSEILKFYREKGIKYFLFAPHLTIFSSSYLASCIICGVAITYENGANVATSFVTNLEECAFRSSPTLYSKIKAANNENLRQQKKELPKYNYPPYVITSNMLTNFSRYGIDFEVGKDECYFIRQLDSQKESKKGLFGSGYLISEHKKAEREKAEREKAEREKAEREKAEREKAEREKAEVWELSDREKKIIQSLK